MRGRVLARSLSIGIMLFALSAAAPAPVNLSRPFGIGPGWQLLSSQGPSVEDSGGNPAPGALHLCITRDDGRTCHPALDTMLALPGETGAFDTIHYLEAVRVVQADARHPLLWVQVASLHGGNGDQRVGRMALGYDRAGGRFVPVYRLTTGRNNNQDVRFVTAGTLRGAILSATPTSDAPFAFWITVNRLGAKGRYAPVLRYRSATRYGDGNPLGVLDSEMPEIQRRLRLRRPGQPLPLPSQPCARPHRVGRVLWC